MYEWRYVIVRFGEILLVSGTLILFVYAFKDEIILSVKNTKIVIAWIILSGIVLVGGMRLGLVPAWQGQESYETLEYVEGRCEYIRSSNFALSNASQSLTDSRLTA